MDSASTRSPSDHGASARPVAPKGHRGRTTRVRGRWPRLPSCRLSEPRPLPLLVEASYSPPVRMAVVIVLVFLVVGSGAAGATSSLPGLPSEVTGQPSLSVRPAVVIFTGDGSGVLGGRDGAPKWNAKKGQFVGFGHFDWKVWTAQRAVVDGVVWARTCWSTSCEGHRYSPFPAKAVASRPVGGRFTRLAVVSVETGKRFVDCRTVQGTAAAGYDYGPTFRCTP